MAIKKTDLGYNGNPNLPKAGTKLDWTMNQMQEYQRCMDDPVYFVKTYMKIVHVDHGVIPFKLYDFQEKIVAAYPANRNLILCQSRQSGKSSVVTGIILHFALFNKDKLIGVLANKLDLAQEILSRIQLAYEHLPAFLKGGVAEWNKKSVKFGNGTKIIAAASSSSAIRGKSCVAGDTFITVRNKSTGIIERIKISEMVNKINPTSPKYNEIHHIQNNEQNKPKDILWFSFGDKGE